MGSHLAETMHKQERWKANQPPADDKVTMINGATTELSLWVLMQKNKMAAKQKLFSETVMNV